ncbi:hypothetical protein C5167_036881 [Papaver somniferum]|uniref:Uncharacterized protein n=1 Tax=Papaver somniferum TaxID=3469 RepID=A0A4Y7I4Y0_PAPSO|nr:hypothetical protein C5167_036881 [Papaver somniferum]
MEGKLLDVPNVSGLEGKKIRATAEETAALLTPRCNCTILECGNNPENGCITRGAAIIVGG